SQNGPEERLNQTEYTQPALLTAEIALWKIWRESCGNSPAFENLIFAGHSLGEFTALVCAEALPFKTALHLVQERGRFMQAAVAEGKGSMAAILGLPDDAVREVCAEVNTESALVSAANFNAPGQVVIAGSTEAVLAAMELAKTRGAKRAIKLQVSVP